MEGRLSTRIPRSLREELHHLAELSGKTMADVLQEAIEEKLHGDCVLRVGTNVHVIRDTALPPHAVQVHEDVYDLAS